MKILIISQWFQPEPHYKGLAFAKALSAQGHEVSVLTGFPNYPGGKVYEGYKVRAIHRETMDGIPVTRVYLYPDHGRSAIKRIANYVSFAFSTSLVSFFLDRPDAVYVYTPPMTATLPAVLLRLFRRVPFVVDVQDLWPDTLSATGMISSRLVLKLVGLWTNFAFRRASRIVVLSDGFRTELLQRNIAAPITVVPNWAPPEIVSIARDIAPAGDAGSDTFSVLFAGNMGAAQGLEVVVEAARILRERGVEMRFDLVGSGVRRDAIETLASTEAPGMVRFHEARHPSEMGSIFASADVLLVHLVDDPLFAITIPSKVQAYLAVGRPILIGVMGDAARMVIEAGAGIQFAPGSARALADAVEELMSVSQADRADMGQRGRSYYNTNLTFETGTVAISRELELAAGIGKTGGR